MFISKIADGGTAERDGRLQVGDKVLSVRTRTWKTTYDRPQTAHKNERWDCWQLYSDTCEIANTWLTSRKTVTVSGFFKELIIVIFIRYIWFLHLAARPARCLTGIIITRTRLHENKSLVVLLFLRVGSARVFHICVAETAVLGFSNQVTLLGSLRKGSEPVCLIAVYLIKFERRTQQTIKTGGFQTYRLIR